MSPTHFRYLLCLSLVTGIFSVALDSMIPALIPEAISQAQACEEAKVVGLALALMTVLGLTVLITYILAFFGLFNFRPWAPRLALISTVLTVLCLPTMSVSINSPWAAALNEISTILWGAVLTLVYFSPLKEKFHAAL
jgi:hypothetical protein